MLLNDIRCVLDGITRLLVRSGVLEDMRWQNIPEIMRSVREQALDGSAAGIGGGRCRSVGSLSASLHKFGGIVCRV